MDLELTGKVVVVTGGAKGIGAAIVRALAREGAVPMVVDRDEAAARVPDEMVLQSSLIGTEAMVRERVRKYRDAGINMLRLDPMGETLSERLDTLTHALEIVRQECDGARNAAAG